MAQMRFNIAPRHEYLSRAVNCSELLNFLLDEFTKDEPEETRGWKCASKNYELKKAKIAKRQAA